MADDIYIVNLRVPTSTTVTVDDGSGNDWLVITGAPLVTSYIDLSYVSDGSGNATQASGFYFSPDNVGHRLVINGTIENARGSNGVDEVQGNQANNTLFGDQSQTGLGKGDTIDADRGNDTAYGGAGNDQISGDLGNDTLYGDAGNDVIDGDGGVDTIVGGTGADILSGGGDNGDTVGYSSSGAAVVIDITYGDTTTGRGGDATGDQIRGFTNVLGSSFNDIIRDTVKGTIAFGYNNNTFSGGSGNDQLTLGGGNDKGYGGDGSDYLNGEDGNDSLFGDGSVDSVYGALGRDTLFGGAGADRFIFVSLTDSRTTPSGRDIIADFSGTDRSGITEDKIDLSSIDAVAGGTANERFKFIGAEDFTKVKGQLHYVLGTNGFMIEGDVNGDARADFAIELSRVVKVFATDFIL